MRMKIGLAAALMLAITGMASWGQSAGEISVGALFEENLSGRQGMSMAGGLIAGYGITERFTIGVKSSYGNDFGGLRIFEAMTYGRYYRAIKSIEDLHLWVQMEVGGITLIEKGRDGIGSAAVALSAGARFSFNSFYAEPYIWVGYPVPFGLGVIFGCKF